MLKNVGVVAASILSVSISVYFSFDKQTLIEAQFLQLTLESDTFRTYLCNLLDGQYSSLLPPINRTGALCEDCSRCNAGGICGASWNIRKTLRIKVPYTCAILDVNGRFSGDRMGTFAQTAECSGFWVSARILLADAGFSVDKALVMYSGDTNYFPVVGPLDYLICLSIIFSTLSLVGALFSVHFVCILFDQGGRDEEEFFS